MMVSVVVPTKNRAELLDQTLRSISEQAAPATEVIVADDGSTDRTAEVVARHGATLIRNPDGGGWGAAGARNAGLERVTTDFVAFVDSDDLLLPGALAALVAALQAAPSAPFAFGQGLSAARSPRGWAPQGLIRPDPAELEAPLAALYVRNSVPSSGALVRTAAARAVGGFDTSLRFVEDHDFWLRLARRGEPVHVPELVSIYRIHAQNRHGPAAARQDAERITARGEDDPLLAAHVPERLGVELCEVTIAALRGRRPAEAARAAAQALRRPRRAGVLRRLLRHFRARRSWYREGSELWSARRELRDWLASY
jgi:glycosyltransferase involved in cell wall biosynthesis